MNFVAGHEMYDVEVVLLRCSNHFCHEFVAGGTVDGCYPAAVDRWFIPFFTVFYTSQVVQDFFHQQ